MLRAIAFSTILVFAGADPALAQDDDFARNGIYLSVNMAGAWYRYVQEDLEEAASIGVTVEEPLGLGARVGYRFYPHLAAEAQFQWFSQANIQFFGEKFAVDVLKLETLVFTGNVKGYLLTGRIQPFLLAGAGLMHFYAKDELGLGLGEKIDDFAARFGGGIDFYVTPNIVAFAEGGYVLPTGKLERLDHVVWSVGLQYRF
jgi:opacity protein-like surface antigen